MLGLMMTPAEYDASEVYKAIKVCLVACLSLTPPLLSPNPRPIPPPFYPPQGLGTDESTLIEVLCTRTNEEILALKKKYKSGEQETGGGRGRGRRYIQCVISLQTMVILRRMSLLTLQDTSSGSSYQC